MATTLYSDQELDSLRALRKQVTNPGSRWADKPTGAPAHRQRSFKAVGEDKAESRFEIYQRQNLLDPPVPMIYETTSLLRLVWGRGGFDG